MASCSASRRRRIADARDPPARPAPASPSAANIAAGAFVTLAGTCSPPRSKTAACPRITLPVPPGATTARVMPSTRVTGITVENAVERVDHVERGAEFAVGRGLIRRPFRREPDLDDADVRR